jgi:hypothetical protein
MCKIQSFMELCEIFLFLFLVLSFFLSFCLPYLMIDISFV